MKHKITMQKIFVKMVAQTSRFSSYSSGSAPHSRQAKAESLIVNSVGHRPTNRSVPSSLALKGRHQDFAPSELMRTAHPAS